MRNIKAEILDRLKDGPVRRREVLQGRGVRFRMAYEELRREGKIVEHMHPYALVNEPIWAHLPEHYDKIPSPPVRRAGKSQIDALIQIGMDRKQAVDAIYKCKTVDNLGRLMMWAQTQVKKNPVDRRRRGRPRKEQAVPQGV